MSELRQRKPVDKVPEPIEEDDKPKPSKTDSSLDLEPSLPVMITLFVGFMSVIVFLATYKFSHANNGAFAAYINTHLPIVNTYLNRDPNTNPLFGASAQSVPPESPLSLSESELLAFDGTDPDKPLLLAINGTIFDVSASPSFYGPGGHYNHFIGRDASRAWVTECWDDPEQLTWRMDGIEEMFMPQWLDEQLEAAAKGALDPKIYKNLKGAVPTGMVEQMAKRAIQLYGTVDEATTSERRIQDKAEAKEAVEATLGKWVRFFEGNAKYKVVGKVILDEGGKPAPPDLCEAALKKRPIKGGKLEPLMGTMESAMGDTAKKAKQALEDEKVPDFVKGEIRKAQDAVEKAKGMVGEKGGDAKDKVEEVKEKVKEKLREVREAVEKVKGKVEGHEEL